MPLFGPRLRAGRAGTDRPTTGGSRADRSRSAVTLPLVDLFGVLNAPRRVRNDRLFTHAIKCMRSYFISLTLHGMLGPCA